MIRNTWQQWHICQGFSETSPPFFHSRRTLAPSCLNTLSFPEYHENMWESLRKYLSQADTASHFYSISSLWISADLMATKYPTLYWVFRLLEGGYSPFFLKKWHDFLLNKDPDIQTLVAGLEILNKTGWGASSKSEVSLLAMHACRINHFMI